MKNGWTLAQTQPAEQDSTEVIKAEDISSGNQQTMQTTTQQADPNAVPITGRRQPLGSMDADNFPCPDFRSSVHGYVQRSQKKTTAAAADDKVFKEK